MKPSKERVGIIVRQKDIATIAWTTGGCAVDQWMRVRTNELAVADITVV